MDVPSQPMTVHSILVWTAVSIVLAPLAAAAPAPREEPRLDAATAGRFANLALACVHKEYPNKIAHALNGDADVKPPRLLTPAFYGCYDWHSAVHGHWLLARLARQFPEAPFAAKARAALDQSLTAANLAAEAKYMEGEGRGALQRPHRPALPLQVSAGPGAG